MTPDLEMTQKERIVESVREAGEEGLFVYILSNRAKIWNEYETGSLVNDIMSEEGSTIERRGERIVYIGGNHGN